VSKTIRVSEEVHALVASHQREGETMEETLKRLVGGPHPEEVAGLLSDETAEAMHESIDERGRETDRERVAELFADDGDP
jgi:NAD(P)H-hydrate repair Nnr-like enzyme with NAD(P)H-hydrate dehydratase domain